MKASFQYTIFITSVFLSHIFSVPFAGQAHITESNMENAVLILQVVAGENPTVEYSQIPDKTPNGLYGLPEVIDLLTDNNGVFIPAKGPTLYGSIGMSTWTPQLGSSQTGQSTLAKWKFGKQTAMVISYDDSPKGNVLYGIPQMFARGLVGTWFVNPGRDRFQYQKDLWHEAYTTHGQSVANHTWMHNGALNDEGIPTEEGARASISLGGSYIRKNIYKLPDNVKKIIGFNHGGGTTWHIEDKTSEEWNQLIREHYSFERRHSSTAGKLFVDLKAQVLEKFDTGVFRVNGGSIHFHGICNESGCTLDDGIGAIQTSELYPFYDWLVDPNEFPAQNIWITGYAEYRKYPVLLEGSTVTLLDIDSNGNIHLDLSFVAPSPHLMTYEKAYGLTWGPNNEMGDEALYEDLAITLYTKVPGTWNKVKVSQENGETHIYKAHAGEVRYEAYVNRGEITLEDASNLVISIPYADLGGISSTGSSCAIGAERSESQITSLYESQTVSDLADCEHSYQVRTATCPAGTWVWADWSTPTGFETCSVP